MEVKARIKDIDRNLLEGVTTFTLTTKSEIAAEELEKMQEQELRVKVVRYRKKRSLSANALFWHCVGEISKVLQMDKWDVYLRLLKDYGKFTYIVCRPEMVDSIRTQWRESMVWNSVDVNGEPAVQMLCFFGSSSYNTKEMSVLIDGTIETMKELGLDTPMSQDVRAALERWDIEFGQHYPE